MSGRHPKILIVDDDETVRASLERLLVGEDYRVEAARSGVDALGLLGGDGFGLVMLDLRMPQLGGMTVLQHLRKHHPKTPVIVMTGFPSIENAKQAIELGAFHFLLKPLDPDTTRNVVSSALASSALTVHER